MNTQVKYSQPQNLEQHPLGDLIQELPSDSSVPSHNEIRIVDKLFQQKKSIIDKILYQTKDIIILGGLFILLSLPFTDEIITKFITITRTSPYILIGVKALLFVLSFFVIKNIYLVRIKD
jgi:hypothetical protein